MKLETLRKQMSFVAAVAVGLKKATGSLKGTQTFKIFFFVCGPFSVLAFWSGGMGNLSSLTRD